MSSEMLGIDVGGVILDFAPYTDTQLDFRGHRYLLTPEVPDAVESIAALNREGRFAGNIYLVTRVKDGPKRVLTWLHHRKFFERTGIPIENFNHCTERRHKAPICKDLGITHFVDDRAEVLSYMLGIVPNLYQLQHCQWEDDYCFPGVDKQIVHVANWKDLVKKFS